MAVIISFLSEYKENVVEKEYWLPDPVNKEYSGVHTNQAPLYYLTKCAKNNLKDNETIKYLFIVSKSVYYKKVHNETFTPRELTDTPTKSQYEYYEHFCKDLNKKCEVKCEVFHIPYDFEKNVQENSAPLESKVIANNIYQKINEQIKDNEKVYIDYTGGLRDTSYLLVTLIQYLEIKNVTCESIVYSQFAPPRVRRIKYIYKINNIIQGAHDFIATGDITKLKEFFYDAEKYPAISPLIEELDKFVKAVSIGQIDGLDTIKNNINDFINGFDANVTTNGKTDLYMNIFKLLFPKIKESLYIDDSKGAENKFGYIEIVKWCIAHRFIQQAFTIYVEKFPEIYLDCGIDGLIDDSKVKIKGGASFESTKFYTTFWESLEDAYEKRLGEYLREKYMEKEKNRDKKDPIDIFESILDGEFDEKFKEAAIIKSNFNRLKTDLTDNFEDTRDTAIAEADNVAANGMSILTKEAGEVEKKRKELEAISVSNNVTNAKKLAIDVLVSAKKVEEVLQVLENAKQLSGTAQKDWSKAENLGIQAKLSARKVVKIARKMVGETITIENKRLLSIRYTPRTFWGFVCSPKKEKMLYSMIKDESPKLAYYLLGRGNSYVKNSPYKKKADVIQNLLDRNNNNQYDSLISVMRAYLCVKIIRNNMNHASSFNEDDEEAVNVVSQIAKTLLKTETDKNNAGFKENEVFDYDRAVEIIKKGVKITEKIVKKNKPLLTEDQYKELTGA